ncbi:SRPBCC family protein [Vallitalea okinawensis]|uniref:SRPBCC family protein n=1 Tax=Vallitalea okinawensis TaxID=2078660 RepID=UPI000CFB5BBC|nr:SRPBCC domain-containing protein [Vallitalea okinawensis]
MSRKLKTIIENNDIYFDFVINVPVSGVWKQLTTEEGIKSFFAPHFKVDFEVGGRFEILFDTAQEAGKQGSEGMTILALEKEKLLSFTWSAPPEIPTIRLQRTMASFYLFEESGKTRIVFRNIGFGQGEDWRKARNYFIRAWGEIVLPRLKYSLEVEAINWLNMQSIEPINYSQ